jgi:hypothetical protein
MPWDPMKKPKRPIPAPKLREIPADQIGTATGGGNPSPQPVPVPW